MPAARRKPRARRSAPPSAWRVRLPALEQRHWDLIGLGLVAIGIFLVFLVYLGWDGGQAGSGLVDGLAKLVGELHYLVPVALLAAGALVFMRDALPAVRPFRAAALCLGAAGCLALAAGTLGLGAGGDRVEDNGGYVGAGPLRRRVGAGRRRRLPHHRGLPLRRRDAAAHGRERGVACCAPRATRSPRAAARSARPPSPCGPPSSAAARRARSSTSWRPPSRRPSPARTWSRTSGAGPSASPTSTTASRRPTRSPTSSRWSSPSPSRSPSPLEPEEPRLAEDPETDEPGVVRGGTEVDPADLTPQGRLRRSVTDAPDFVWRVPDPGFLTRSGAEASKPDTAGQEKVAAQLVEALGHFGVEARVIGMVAGPHITRYELRLAPGIKVGKVAQLKDDLAYALAASDIRILAPIPGKQAVGVEVPNARRRIVHLGDVMQPPPEGWSPLTVWLGKDVAGRAIGADLAKMPHLLVAGTTGAGKSGAVNAMLASILLRATPHEVRLVLVDPKQVELNHYDSIPHLLTPVITSPKQAAIALQNLVREMEQRYSYMALARTRSLIEMNKVRERRGEQALPYILCVIDELADLMMVAPADVEDSIIRLAQKARAVGIHLVLATQSPRVDVITGMIKANVPSRIAFAVSSQTDSRVILDQNGAETLLGQGDMLFAPVGSSRLQRIQGAYVDEAQIERLTEQWRKQGEPEFREELLEEAEEEVAESGPDDGFDPDEDPLLTDAIRLVAEMQTASTSMLQRRLRLGYTRAGRLIDMLERRGVISGYEGSKPRQVLISEADVPRVLAALEDRGGGVPVPDDDGDGDVA